MYAGRSALLVLLSVCWYLQLAAGAIDCSSGDSCLVQCSAQINVDPDSSTDCWSLVGSGDSVVNQTCSSLQDVLNGLAEVSGYDRDDCILVLLQAGVHVVTRSVTIRRNLVLRGPESATAPSVPPQQQVLGDH